MSSFLRSFVATKTRIETKADRRPPICFLYFSFGHNSRSIDQVSVHQLDLALIPCGCEFLGDRGGMFVALRWISGWKPLVIFLERSEL